MIDHIGPAADAASDRQKAVYRDSRTKGQLIQGEQRLQRAHKRVRVRLRRCRTVANGMAGTGVTGGADGVEPRLAEVMAAANYHLVRGGHQRLEVWASA
ncbi:hypothetical protein V1286_007611 [Bradyrhizobium algeriense]|uniref:Uncharacterized protein n=1 Tax=Bradyrhizobium algeriense TaxID=634784 RepID=A0ABU8BNG4_9BRAD